MTAIKRKSKMKKSEVVSSNGMNGKLAELLHRRQVLIASGCNLSFAERKELEEIGDIPHELVEGVSVVPSQTLVNSYTGVVEDIGTKGYDVTGDENFHDTPVRAAKAMTELIWSRDRILSEVGKMLGKVFPGRYSGMVVQPNIFVPCVCPHHLLPVMMRVSIGYVPARKCLGISKLSRIAKTFGHQPIMQEEYTDQLLHLLQDGLGAKGVAIFVRGYHTCQSIRGACVHDVVTVTESLSGIFFKPAPRAEFFALATAGQNSIV
jgi:GTP cyclohydrolase I